MVFGSGNKPRPGGGCLPVDVRRAAGSLVFKTLAASMLSREQRLKRLEINQFFKPRTPPRFTCAWFDLWSRPNSTTHNRYAVIVPSKILTHAVDRTYWRRRIYAALQSWPNRQKDKLILLKQNPQAPQQKKDLLASLAQAQTF